ncbi:MAG TPA: hypothetical protein VGB30_13125 [bacterium]
MGSYIRDGVNLSQRTLPVLITVDVCDGAYSPGIRKSKFREVMNTLPGINDLISSAINKNHGYKGSTTWFVRADGQVGDTVGRVSGLYRGWIKFWDEIQLHGGEVSWHPHLYRRTGKGWLPIRDGKRLAVEAEKIWNEITMDGWKPTSCRIGESACSSELMNFLNSAGLLVDASALPGRVRDDGHRWFDWEITPNKPYHPARGDYRRPPRTLGEGDNVDGEAPLELLEIPFTMAEIRAPYDSIDPSLPPPRRYVDLSFDPERIKSGLSHKIHNLDYLMLIIHPLQASGRSVPDGEMIRGGDEIVRENLQSIESMITDAGRKPMYVTMSELYHLMTDEQDVEEDKSRKFVPSDKIDGRYERLKGGVQRTVVEGEKKQKRVSQPDGQSHLGTKPTNPRGQRGPRTRRG